MNESGNINVKARSCRIRRSGYGMNCQTFNCEPSETTMTKKYNEAGPRCEMERPIRNNQAEPTPSL
jgi:hypothetical protein